MDSESTDSPTAASESVATDAADSEQSAANRLRRIARQLRASMPSPDWHALAVQYVLTATLLLVGYTVAWVLRLDQIVTPKPVTGGHLSVAALMASVTFAAIPAALTAPFAMAVQTRVPVDSWRERAAFLGGVWAGVGVVAPLAWLGVFLLAVISLQLGQVQSMLAAGEFWPEVMAFVEAIVSLLVPVNAMLSLPGALLVLAARIRDSRRVPTRMEDGDGE